MTLSITLFIAFLTTFITLIGLNKIAPAIGLVDHPSPRKVHATQTPLTGGISIAIGIAITFILAIPTLPASYAWIMCGALCMVVTGAYDDVKNLPVLHRFCIQSAVGTVIIFGADLTIDSIGTYPIIGEVKLGFLAYPITLFALLTGINAMNLIDGLDGLASGLGVVAFSILSILGFTMSSISFGILCGIIAMALLGFLSKNMRFPWQKSAKAFLGDAGSTALGFTLAAFVIQATNSETPLFSPPAALWFLAIPLIDTLSVMLRRVENGHHAFKASKDHLHHILLSRLQSVSKTVAVILFTSLSLILLGLLLEAYASDAVSLFAFSVILMSYHIALKYLAHPVKEDLNGASELKQASEQPVKKVDDQQAA